MSNNDRIQEDGKLRAFIVPADILDVPDLTTAEKLVYIALRSYTNPHDSSAFPAYETIAKKASLSRRRVIDVIKSLVEKGLIKKEPRLQVTKDRKIKNTSNLYTLEMPEPRKVKPCHQRDSEIISPGGSETISPGVVKPFHQGSETISPYQYHLTESLLIMIDRLIDSEVIAKFLKSKPENLKYEHIEVIAEINQAYITHPDFTENLLIEKISACLKTYKRSFKACLRKSIENELNKPSFPVKQRAKAKKPAIPIVQPAGQQTGPTDEELQRILNKARKLDEKFKS
ncbi:helix-turn-helix domain-containing protein [Paenibacillus larvae]|uniref:helix-turn-helix domain-containing protein n=1 Tax=Paenibacillus larvae TaxID=1464 RepID=UPI00227F41FC|nr:helix-turn-helix domain-containing protein [Paenibacillus larvae]MCY9508471.1 helix-turn-helix domain-containing protein [Paenibacillus larvae]MCY9523825.1 helix-turn-helix domain-containing protein [Paenibacillus larvae]